MSKHYIQSELNKVKAQALHKHNVMSLELIFNFFESKGNSRMWKSKQLSSHSLSFY